MHESQQTNEFDHTFAVLFDLESDAISDDNESTFFASFCTNFVSASREDSGGEAVDGGNVEGVEREDREGVAVLATGEGAEDEVVTSAGRTTRRDRDEASVAPVD